MTQDLLKKQQETFKDQIDELYFIHKKIEDRVIDFTAKQTDLLKQNKESLKEIRTDIASRLQNEAFRFEKARREIAEDMSWHSFRSYGLYILYVVVLVASVTSIWTNYTDVTNRPWQLNDICLSMARGKVVAIDPKSIVKEEIDGKEVTLAKIIK